MNNNEKMPVSWNTFNHVFDPNGTGVSNGFETVLSTSLLENDDMRDLFLERLSYYMTEVFTTDKMTAAIEELYETMQPEMEKHFERWPDHAPWSPGAARGAPAYLGAAAPAVRRPGRAGIL